MTLVEGQLAPDFTLPNEFGAPTSLSSYRGKRHVVVYFYPRDNTPGCTIEAVNFRDLMPEFSKLECVVLGISADDKASHCGFIEKYDLNYSLLTDADYAVMKAYGAYGKKMLYGKEVEGVIRSTVLLNKDGTIVKHWAKVPSAEEHPASVLKSLKALQGL